MLKKIALSKLVILAVLLVSLVLSYIPDMPFQLPGPDIAQQNFHVIEFNDDGMPHAEAQWEGLKARLAQPQQTAPELLIFVHGWHHNAASTDENFVAFQQFYQQMAASDKQRNLIGLYIGWRGDKYDPFWLDGSDDASSWIEPLDFPTIFQRRAVAKRVGEKGFSALLDLLDQQEASGALQRYTVIGHSLGGVVALHASKDRIVDALAKKQDNPNLFVLLNPAVPTRELKPLDELFSHDRQKPSMVVLQSKGDFALKKAFNWLKEGERAMGNSWAITHDIDRCPRGNCSTPLKMPKSLQIHDATPGCMMTLPQSGWKVRARLQARRQVQTCPDANMQAVWVLAVSDEIINGHNGILTADHAKALSEVMSMIDLYRNQLPLVQHQPAKLEQLGLTDADGALTPEQLAATAESVVEGNGASEAIAAQPKDQAGEQDAAAEQTEPVQAQEVVVPPSF